MSPRIYFPIYYWWSDRNYFIKLSTRHHPSRYILCCGTLSLCLKNRSSIRHICCIYTLIPAIYRINTSRTMNKSAILYNIYWSKPYILPTTLLRSKRYTPSLLRLSRRIYNMKCGIIYRISSILHCSNILYLYSVRSIRFTTKSYLKIPHTIIYRVT